jgi:hypothetical protein
MEFIWNLFHQIYDVEFLVQAGGLVVLTIIVFVETGLLIGFFCRVTLCWRPPEYSPTANGARPQSNV